MVPEDGNGLKFSWDEGLQELVVSCGGKGGDVGVEVRDVDEEEDGIQRGSAEGELGD